MNFAMAPQQQKAAPASKAPASALRIGEPNDAFEREADRVAGEITAADEPQLKWSFAEMGIGPRVQRECACGGSGECEDCKKKKLQRKAISQMLPASGLQSPGVAASLSNLRVGTAKDPREGAAHRLGEELSSGSAYPAQNGAPPHIQRHTEEPLPPEKAAPASVDRALAIPGRPLDPNLQQNLGPRFGYDFSRVRVHSGPAADQSARDVNAHAYTVGDHIVFASGQFQPDTRQGQRLIAHELTHVVQQANGRLARSLQRQRCGHDGRPTGCGRGTTGRIAGKDKSGTLFTYPFSGLVIGAMERNFGGEWALEVQTPRNLLKNPRRNEEDTGDSGFIDGAKVTVGQTLKVEVVEVKARSEDGGGCTRATGEALRYIGSLKSLAPLMVPLSERLAAAGGLRVDKGCQSPNAGQRRTLIAAGVDFNDQVSLNAWCFYNSLQVKLKRVFTTPFSKVDIIANADGVKDVPYDIQPPILINCPNRTEGKRYLQFQVNNQGGVSYGCRDECGKRKEDEEKQLPKEATKDISDEAHKTKSPRLDQEKHLDLPSGDPKQPGVPRKKDDPRQIQTQPDDSISPDDLKVLEITGGTIATVAVLHQSLKVLKSRVARQEAEKLIEKTIEKGVEKGGLKLLKDLDSHHLAEYGEKAGEEVLKLADKRLAGIAARYGPKALKGIGKAAPFLAVALTIKDAEAAISNIRKGATVKIGLNFDDVDLKGDTKVKSSGPKGTMASGDVSLNDTKVDIETKGVPNVSGTVNIEADKVTISGAVSSEGTPVTVNLNVKLSNSTITFTHSGVIQHGKVVTGDFDISDSQIEIDLPEGTLNPGRKPGEKKTIAGAKIKIVKVGGGGEGIGGGDSGPATPGAAPPAGTKTPAPAAGKAPPAAGPERQTLINQINADKDLQKLYTALGGKGIVPTDEVLRRFLALKEKIKQHPDAVEKALKSIKPGELTDPIKQIIEPLERKLAEEDAKPPQTPPAKPPATPPGTNPGDAVSGTPTPDANAPAPGTKPAGKAPAGSPAVAPKATPVRFSDIQHQLVFPPYSLPDAGKAPATYTYWVHWTPKGSKRLYRIPLSFNSERDLPSGKDLWKAEYTFSPPSGTYSAEGGGSPISFSDAGAGTYKATLKKLAASKKRKK